MIRCFVSDLDGTLLNSEHVIAEEDAATILQAQEQGYEFIIATGRSRDSVDLLLKPYAVKCIGILCNGALVLDHEGKILQMHCLDNERVKQIIALLKPFPVAVQLYTKEGSVAQYPEQIRRIFLEMIMEEQQMNEQQADAFVDEHYFFDYQVIVDDWNTYLADDHSIYKMEVYCKDDNQLYQAEKALKQIADIDISHAMSSFELTDIHAQKGITLQTIIQKLGYRMDEVAVFGDGMNDTMMLKHFPNSYAPSNAAKPIKKLARYVIGSHDEHCVGNTIRQIMEAQGNIKLLSKQ